MSGRLRFRVVTVVLIGTFAGTLSAQDKEPTPVRRNPNIDRPITNENFDSAVVNLLQQLVAAYGPIANSNDRPNPYTRIEPFGEPPPGTLSCCSDRARWCWGSPGAADFGKSKRIADSRLA